MSAQSVHAWGFFDGEGKPRLPDGLAPSEMTPHEHFEQVHANITHCGGEVINMRTTRTLDGWFVGAAWETPVREGADDMWHVISKPSEVWPR